MWAYLFVRTLVNVLVLQGKTPPAQVAGSTRPRFVLRWCPCASCIWLLHPSAHFWPIQNNHSTCVPCRRCRAIARAKSKILAAHTLLMYLNNISAHHPLAYHLSLSKYKGSKERNNPWNTLNTTSEQNLGQIAFGIRIRPGLQRPMWKEFKCHRSLACDSKSRRGGQSARDGKSSRRMILLTSSNKYCRQWMLPRGPGLLLINSDWISESLWICNS